MESSSSQLARIAEPENLRQAWRRIQGRKAAGGVDGQTVEGFSAAELAELERLRLDLLEETYVPQPLLQIEIPKAKPGEKRSLGLPTVRDKVAQEAVRRVLEPLINPSFVDQSYGYRPGKGPQRAVKRVCHILATSRPGWVGALDIDEFFPSIDHDLLLEQLRSYGVEEPVCRLLLLWLKMGVVNPGGRWLDVHHGVSQGGVISPLLANIYLHPLDLFLRERTPDFVRYADDLRFFTATRQEGESLYTAIKNFLQTRLKLRLNDIPQPVTPVTAGFVFLGFHFREGRLALDPEKWTAIQHKIQTLVHNLQPGKLAAGMRQLNDSVAGWQRYYSQLVEAAEVARIAKELQTALSQKLASLLVHDQTAAQELRAALAGLELPWGDSRDQQQAFLQELDNQAQEQARQLRQHRETSLQVKKTVLREKQRRLRQRLSLAHLVITTPGLSLGKKGNRVVVRQQRQVLYEVLFSGLESITLLAHGTSLSSDLITYCASQGIPVSWLAPSGEVQAHLIGPNSAVAAVQLRQLEASQRMAEAIAIARAVVLGKIKNQINLIKYFGKYARRRHQGFQEHYKNFEAAAEKLVAEVAAMPKEGEMGKLRGQLFSIEGRLASHYWDMVKLLLTGVVDFPGRRRQGATDMVNSLLNYGYAILRSRVLQAIYNTGLNPALSFLHVPRRQEPTLAYDLMEIFRAQVVDRVVLAELRRRPQGYQLDQEGKLTEETRKTLIRQVESRLAVIQPFRGQELQLREIIQAQVHNLRRHLEGKEKFRPFIGKW